MSRPAVFLDRDGTLIEERHYPTRSADIVPIAGSAESLRRLADAGFLCIVLTNQSAVARGLLDEEQLGVLNAQLDAQLATAGRSFDALYYCPHHPEGTAVGYGFACACRKPGRGLLDLAVATHDVDLARSAYIGDAPRDLFPDAGPALARILVGTGHPLDDVGAADHVAPTIVEATTWLLERRREQLAAEAALRARDA